jgi:hypothetical protein
VGVLLFGDLLVRLLLLEWRCCSYCGRTSQVEEMNENVLEDSSAVTFTYLLCQFFGLDPIDDAWWHRYPQTEKI